MANIDPRVTFGQWRCMSQVPGVKLETHYKMHTHAREDKKMWIMKSLNLYFTKKTNSKYADESIQCGP